VQETKNVRTFSRGDPRQERNGPDFIAPTHCTGWKEINEFAREMPEPFILNCVGTTYLFDSL